MKNGNGQSSANILWQNLLIFQEDFDRISLTFRTIIIFLIFPDVGPCRRGAEQNGIFILKAKKLNGKNFYFKTEIILKADRLCIWMSSLTSLLRQLYTVHQAGMTWISVEEFGEELNSNAYLCCNFLGSWNVVESFLQFIQGSPDVSDLTIHGIRIHPGHRSIHPVPEKSGC